MANSVDSTFASATPITETELLALFDRGAGIDRLVERLIDILDAADAPAEDLEDGHDAESDFDGEATLGAPEQHHNQSKWAKGANTEDGERELFLGAPEQHPGPYCGGSGVGCQLGWAAGNKNPALDEGEPDADLEPWLGAPEARFGACVDMHDRLSKVDVDQTSWARGSDRDLELDAGDERELEDEHGDAVQA